MKKVLILDDESELLEIWLQFFKSWDFLVEVHTAINGAEGLKMVDTVGEYDLIITDFKMPVMNGLEFINTLRAQQTNTRTPIFFFTGYMPELKNHIDVLENVLLFEKPAISQKMKTHIAACLKEISMNKTQNAATI